MNDFKGRKSFWQKQGSGMTMDIPGTGSSISCESFAMVTQIGLLTPAAGTQELHIGASWQHKGPHCIQGANCEMPCNHHSLGHWSGCPLTAWPSRFSKKKCRQEKEKDFYFLYSLHIQWSSISDPLTPAQHLTSLLIPQS